MIFAIALVVRDTDGSAFITKAEFDALKNSFQKQVDNYNDSIDSKIDGAIASYLSGLALVKTTEENLLTGAPGKKLTFFTPADDLAYEFAPLQISGNATRITTGQYAFNNPDWRDSNYTRTMEGFSFIECHFDPSNSETTRFQKKTVIADLDETLQIAKWDGYYEKCQDKLVLNGFLADTPLNTIAAPDFGSFLIGGLHITECAKLTNTPLEGERLMVLSGYATASNANSVYTYLQGYSIDSSFAGESETIYAALFNFNYDMFSNIERTYNWGYDGGYQTTFDGYPTKASFVGNRDNDVFTDIMNYATGGKGRYVMFKFTDLSKNVNGTYVDPPSGTYTKQGFDITEADIIGGKFFTKGSGTEYNVYVPMFGFETTYLTKWEQIYNTDYDQYITAGAPSVVTDASSVKHMRMTNGVPFIELKSGQSFTYTFDFEDKSKDYWIWMKDSPFLNENQILPGTNETTLNLDGCGAKINGAYKINNGTGEVNYTNNTFDAQTIYLKFASGGAATPSSYDTIEGGTLILDKIYIHVPE